MALDLMPADIDCDVTIFPVKVYGDGNCLARTGSLFAFGCEENHEEIRARIVVESVNNCESYLNSKILSSGSNMTETQHLAKVYAQYSDYYIAGVDLTEHAIRTVFENEILSICQRGSYIGIWQIHALATVLKSCIFSVHPVYGSFNTRKHLHRKIIPINGSLKEHNRMLQIMCSNVNGKGVQEALWAPNHFVPLLPVDKVSETVEVFPLFLNLLLLIFLMKEL